MPAYRDEATGKWFAKYQVKCKDGKIKHFKKRGFATKRDAVKWETEAKASFLNSSSMMFETFLTTKYYPYEEQLIKPTSLISKKRIIDTHLLPYFKDYMVKEITVQDVIEWHSWLMEKEAKGKKGSPLSQSTLSIIHGQLHHIMKHAMRILDINKDVVGLAGTIGSGYTKRESFWSLDEFNAFREEMKSRKYDSQMLVAYDILFWAGLRTAELMGLCVEDCNFENNTIRIERNYLRLNGTDYILTPKTRSSQRTVRIPDTVMAELKDYIERLYELPEDKRIFTFSRDKLIRTMKSAGSAAGISTPATPHSLRHSLATLLLEQGFSLTDIGRRLGHAWYGTTLRYLHAPDKAQDKIAETLNELAESSSF